jgi:hypothetical protein
MHDLYRAEVVLFYRMPRPCKLREAEDKALSLVKIADFYPIIKGLEKIVDNERLDKRK